MISFLATLGTAFILIVPVELPDKTFIATLMLATRYKPWPVWLGVTAAFFVQCLVAVIAGKLVTLLPHDIVQWAVVALFLVGAIVLFRSARRSRADEMSDAPAPPPPTRSNLRAAGASFLVLFAAEWGDLSQLLTAGLVAKGGNPVAVFLGSWLGPGRGLRRGRRARPGAAQAGTAVDRALRRVASAVCLGAHAW